MPKTNPEVFKFRRVFQDYFEKKANIILDELQAAASLTPHQQLIGNAGEESTRDFLEELLPQRYGIGTGHVVSFKETSAQADIVIYDAGDCYKIPISKSATIYSIEGVYAAIEIKTSHTKKSSMKTTIKNAVSNIETIKKTSNPFPYSTNSELPAFKNIWDATLFAKNSKSPMNLMTPIGVILIIGSGTNFPTVINNFKEAQNKIEYWHNKPDLLCVIDESNFGLCGNDFSIKDEKVVSKLWQENCESVGEALSNFVYWLLYKINLERIIERPVIYNSHVQAIWPSVFAPAIERIHVSSDETGNQLSWPWENETRTFIDP